MCILSGKTMKNKIIEEKMFVLYNIFDNEK